MTGVQARLLLLFALVALSSGIVHHEVSVEEADMIRPSIDRLRVLYRDIVPAKSLEQYVGALEEFTDSVKPLVDSAKAREVLSSSSIEEDYVQVSGSAGTLDKGELNSLAERYGYKYANLKVMNDAIIAGVSKDAVYAVEIPPFRGISHDEVDALLRSTLGCKVAPIELFEAAMDGSEDVQKLIAAGQRVANSIAESMECVKRVMEEGDEGKSREIMNAIEEVMSREFNLDWLAEVHDGNERMMVRSTGREDTEEVANAGGNASIANVRPNTMDIFYALGEVVMSYFMPKSIMQRSAAGDPYLFEVPRLSVMLQVMKSTKSNSFPYRSGVAYTREPGVSGAEISLIQASYGHNEGVVTSAVAVDTYYVDLLSGKKASVIVDKSMRMEPTSPGEFGKVSNHEFLRHTSALSNEMLRSLSTALEVIHKFYGGEVIRDVEFTIDPESETVYILQARPLQQSATKDRSPSYLPKESIEEFSEDSIGKVSTIVAGSGSVLVFNAENVISAGNLAAALSRWEAMSSMRKGLVKVVFTAQPAPSTSHEAVEFRSKGCVVIHTPPELRMRLRDHLALPGGMLLLDPQQELVFMMKDEARRGFAEMGSDSVAVKSPRGETVIYAKKGWVNYPVSPVFSIDEAADADSWMEETMAAVTVDQGLLAPACSDSECLEVVSNPKEDKDTRQSALRYLGVLNTYSAVFIIDHYLPSSPMGDDAYLRRRVIAWVNSWSSACAMASKAIEDGNDTNALFAVRVMQSLLYQDTVSTRAENAWSLMNFVEELELEKKAHSDARGKQVTYSEATYLLAIHDAVYEPAARETWDTFARQLLTSEKSKAVSEFFDCLPRMQAFKVLIPWMNSVFLDVYKDDRSLNSALRSVSDVCGSDDTAEEALEILNNLQAKMTSVDPASFSTHEGLAENLPYVRKEIVNVICGDDLVSYVEAVENPILYVAVLNVILQWVNQFDECIKAWTGNPENRESGEHRGDFYDMMNENARIIESYLPISTTDMPDSVEQVVRQITEFIREGRAKSGPLDFKVNDNFAVGTAALFTAKYFRVEYNSDEEFFTIIHQSLINLLARMMGEGVKGDIGSMDYPDAYGAGAHHAPSGRYGYEDVPPLPPDDADDEYRPPVPPRRFSSSSSIESEYEYSSYGSSHGPPVPERPMSTLSDSGESEYGSSPYGHPPVPPRPRFTRSDSSFEVPVSSNPPVPERPMHTLSDSGASDDGYAEHAQPRLRGSSIDTPIPLPKNMNVRLPSVVSEFYNFLDSTKGKSGYSAKISMSSIAGDPLEVMINIPLNAHSAIVRLVYYPFKKETVASILMMGTCDHCRWLWVKKAIDDFVNMNQWKGLVRSGGVGLTGIHKLQKTFTLLDVDESCGDAFIREFVEVLVYSFASTNTGAYAMFLGNSGEEQSQIELRDVETAESISRAYDVIHGSTDMCVAPGRSDPPVYTAHALFHDKVDPGYAGCACMYYNAIDGRDRNHLLPPRQREEFAKWSKDNLESKSEMECDGQFAVAPASKWDSNHR